MSSEILSIRKLAAAPRILIIYTGGTMGMVYQGSQLVTSDISSMLKTLPELQRLERNIDLLAWEQPLDSANMKPGHWQKLARQIYEYDEQYDGFVVIHGTDTMAWTASALSFMLEGLKKPIIFTGAQLPMNELRSDARDNLVNALYLAGEQVNGEPVLQEAAIFFDRFLWRGNRSRKVQSNHFDAFMSENYPALAEVGVGIEFNKSVLYRTDKSPRLLDEIDARVALIRIYPGITREQVQAVLSIPDLKGCVLETYGSGNMPTDVWLLQALKDASSKGIVLLNVSQCVGGMVKQGKYATSEELSQMGVVGGEDLTTEAAMVKLMFVLANKPYRDEVKKSLRISLRGEMS